MSSKVAEIMQFSACAIKLISCTVKFQTKDFNAISVNVCTNEGWPNFDKQSMFLAILPGTDLDFTIAVNDFKRAIQQVFLHDSLAFSKAILKLLESCIFVINSVSDPASESFDRG